MIGFPGIHEQQFKTTFDEQPCGMENGNVINPKQLFEDLGGGGGGGGVQVTS